MGSLYFMLAFEDIELQDRFAPITLTITDAVSLLNSYSCGLPSIMKSAEGKTDCRVSSNSRPRCQSAFVHHDASEPLI